MWPCCNQSLIETDVCIDEMRDIERQRRCTSIFNLRGLTALFLCVSISYHAAEADWPYWLLSTNHYGTEYQPLGRVIIINGDGGCRWWWQNETHNKYLVVSTFSTSAGVVMGALDWPPTWSSPCSSPYVELTTYTQPSSSNNYIFTSSTKHTDRLAFISAPI